MVLVALGLRNFYFIALYYNLIWICQVNYHDSFFVYVFWLANMKRKLDMKKNLLEIEELIRLQPNSIVYM